LARRPANNDINLLTDPFQYIVAVKLVHIVWFNEMSWQVISYRFAKRWHEVGREQWSEAGKGKAQI
jgi:hypothetical protein